MTFISKKYILIFIALSSLFFSLWGFITVPGFWFDEGIIAGVAQSIADNGIYGTQIAPNIFYTNNFWITTGYPVVFPMALVFKIFGSSVVTARIIPLFYLVLFVIVSFFFVRKLYGEIPALFSTSLVATFAPFYGNGKAVLGETPGLFWIILGGLLYLLFEERKEKKFLIFAALSWGLAAATKPYYLLFAVSALFVAMYARFRTNILETAEVWLSAVVFLLPVFLWAFFSFDTSSFPHFGSTASYFLNSYGVATFNPLGNLLRFVTESTPIHFAVLAVIVFTAWFTALRQNIQPPVVITGLLIFVALSFFWYLKTPGWYRYFYSIHVLVLLLFPAALLFLAERWNMRRLAYGGLVALIVFQAIFLFITHNQFFGDGVLRLQVYVNENIAKDSSIFVASKPEAFFVLPHINKFQYVFINQDLIIGEESIAGKSYDYLITGAEDELFFAYNKERIAQKYSVIESIDGYTIYQKIK